MAALVATLTHDQQVTVAEAEALRAICAALHVPLPMVPHGAPAAALSLAPTPALSLGRGFSVPSARFLVNCRPLQALPPNPRRS